MNVIHTLTEFTPTAFVPPASEPRKTTGTGRHVRKWRIKLFVLIKTYIYFKKLCVFTFDKFLPYSHTTRLLGPPENLYIQKISYESRNPFAPNSKTVVFVLLTHEIHE